MKILFIAEDTPNRHHVHGDGSSLMSFHVVAGLGRKFDVTLVSFDSTVAIPEEIEAATTGIHVLPLRDRRAGVAGAPLTGQSMAAFQRLSRANRRAVGELSGDADVTLLHGPHVLPLGRFVRSPMVIQSVDPWSLRLSMEAGMAPARRRAYLRIRARQALAVERRIPRPARLITVGRRDAVNWSRLLRRPVRAVPNGVDTHVSVDRNTERAPVVCFAGSLNYGPNVDSAERLVRQIAPRIWDAVPDCQIVIAGRQPTERVLELAGPKVRIEPDVPVMAEVFAGADVALFADRFGLGVRNSVMEAIAVGTSVVATPVAAREIPASPNLTIAEDDDALAAGAVAKLRSRGVPRPRVPDVPIRTWDDALAEYLEEMYAAIG